MEAKLKRFEGTREYNEGIESGDPKRPEENAFWRLLKGSRAYSEQEKNGSL